MRTQTIPVTSKLFVLEINWFHFVAFVQEVEFPSRGSVRLAVIYPRIQTKSFAMFLRARQTADEKCNVCQQKQQQAQILL